MTIGIATATRMLRRTLAALAVCGGLVAAVGSPAALAAPAGPPLPVEFDLARYQPIDPTPFQSLNFADDGRSYFVAGRWLCNFGPSYRNVTCKGRPATAPPGTQGALIAADQQGPWWVTPAGIFGPTTQLAPRSGFAPPVLRVGKRLTVTGTTCTVPRPDVVACTTGTRAMILTPGWQKFFFPSGDTAHSANPAPRYLPPRLQYWNQLPASFVAPK